ncbi:4654_t:CDS:2, partial [Gigaspora rosea]
PIDKNRTCSRPFVISEGTSANSRKDISTNEPSEIRKQFDESDRNMKRIEQSPIHPESHEAPGPFIDKNMMIACWLPMPIDWIDNPYGSFASVQKNVEVQAYIDGHDYFQAIEKAISKAKKEILIMGWWLSPELVNFNHDLVVLRQLNSYKY